MKVRLTYLLGGSLAFLIFGRRHHLNTRVVSSIKHHSLNSDLALDQMLSSPNQNQGKTWWFRFAKKDSVPECVPPMPLGSTSRKSPFRSRLWSAYLAVGLTAVVILGCNLIPNRDAGYSRQLPLRWQTERMLDGQISLSQDPSGMAFDLAWGPRGVQQVWGLALPVWRLAFESAAHSFGGLGFPDRLTFAFTLATVIYILIRIWTGLPDAVAGPFRGLWGSMGLLVTVLFPPFLALCSSRFVVYEEVEAYAYLTALLLLGWSVWVCVRPTSHGWLGLALFAGLTVFVRPTYGVYGLASLISAGLFFRPRERRMLLLGCGAILFVLPLMLLLWSNQLRFGSVSRIRPFPNINDITAMAYATRFGNPFQSEPIFHALRELFGMLFLTRSIVGTNPYDGDLFFGQTTTFRWRELYFSTFDLTIFAMAMVVWLWSAKRVFLTSKRRLVFSDSSLLEIAAVWSFITVIPLTVFYLRYPLLSSRYMLDFGPAFSAASFVSG